MNIILCLFTALLVKHFIVDFPLQGPFCYLNKGKYGHPGGLYHSGLHAIATFFIMLLAMSFDFAITMSAVVFVSIVDFVVHYHTDWAKVQINTRYNLKADNSEYFWWLLGLDQLIHGLTYVWIVSYLV